MLLVVLFFLGFLALGMPIAYAIGISGVVFFLQHLELPFTMIVQLPISQTQNFAMLAVPLFIFAGNLMNEAGITERLIKLSKVLTGHMVGGLAQVSVVLSTFMGGVSGSAIADAAMEARILGPGMIQNGYSKGYSANVIAFTALITATIPPGVGIIIYGTVGEVSIGQLFAAGLIVGIIMMAMLMVTVYITAKRRGYKPVNDRPPTFTEVLVALKETIWALLFPFLFVWVWDPLRTCTRVPHQGNYRHFDEPPCNPSDHHRISRVPRNVHGGLGNDPSFHPHSPPHGEGSGSGSGTLRVDLLYHHHYGEYDSSCGTGYVRRVPDHGCILGRVYSGDVPLPVYHRAGSLSPGLPAGCCTVLAKIAIRVRRVP